MEIVGLKNITDRLNTYSLDTLPRSIILVGKEGSGKHVVSQYISKHFNLPLLDISEVLSEELIANIYREAALKLYLIDLRKIAEKEQNILLKLFEEPPSAAFIVLLANNSFNILPTILNRGHLIALPAYDRMILDNYAKSREVNIDQKYLSTVVETPGDVEKLYTNNISLSAIRELTDKIIDKVSIASFANTLSIADKLNYKDEYDKIDLAFFLKMLAVTSYQQLAENNKTAYIVFKLTADTIRKLADPRVNKRIAILNMLGNLWKEVHE